MNDKRPFSEILLLAKQGDQDALEAIIEQYQGLLYKKSFIDGSFDEDLHQILSQTLVNCVKKFLKESTTPNNN